MHSSCIPDSVANLLVRHMVFGGNVQKSLIASHLKGFDPSLSFCCQGPALTGIKEGVRVRSKRDVLVPPYDLQSKRTAVFWAILERISGFGSAIMLVTYFVNFR